jgi:SPP1 family predicted phage head-tail adaptor
MIQATGLKQQMKIGAMDERISLKLRGAETKNGLGEVTAIATTTVDMWAHVMYDDRDEDELLNKQTVVSTPTFVIRHYSTLDVMDQITWGSITYDILNIEPIGRRSYMKVKTKHMQ